MISWSYFYKDFPYFSSPAVNDHYVVIGGRDRNIHCIDSKTGLSIWRHNAGAKIDSSPVLCDDKVIIGTENGRLVILTAAKGEIEWEYDIGSAITSSPAIVQGRLYVSSTDGSLYAFGEKK